MKPIHVLTRIAKLFVDDGPFALAIAAWLAGSAGLPPRLPGGAEWGPAAMFAGLACILVAEAFRAAKIKRTAQRAAG